MEQQTPPPIFIVWIWVFFIWSIFNTVWFIRNPMAGPGTSITRIGHVFAMDRMAEYQTPNETHESMPQPHPPL